MFMFADEKEWRQLIGALHTQNALLARLLTHMDAYHADLQSLIIGQAARFDRLEKTLGTIGKNLQDIREKFYPPMSAPTLIIKREISEKENPTMARHFECVLGRPDLTADVDIASIEYKLTVAGAEQPLLSSPKDEMESPVFVAALGDEVRAACREVDQSGNAARGWSPELVATVSDTVPPADMVGAPTLIVKRELPE